MSKLWKPPMIIFYPEEGLYETTAKLFDSEPAPKTDDIGNYAYMKKEADDE